MARLASRQRCRMKSGKTSFMSRVRKYSVEGGLVHPHLLRAAFIMAALGACVPLRDVQIAAPVLGQDRNNLFK
jgi:hypothetical protein